MVTLHHYSHRFQILSHNVLLKELKTRQIQPILDSSEVPIGGPIIDEIAASIGDFAAYHLGGGRLRSLDFARRISEVT